MLSIKRIAWLYRPIVNMSCILRNDNIILCYTRVLCESAEQPFLLIIWPAVVVMYNML